MRQTRWSWTLTLTMEISVSCKDSFVQDYKLQMITFFKRFNKIMYYNK